MIARMFVQRVIEGSRVSAKPPAKPERESLPCIVQSWDHLSTSKETLEPIAGTPGTVSEKRLCLVK